MRASAGPWLVRLIFAAFGVIALGLGIVGAFVPLLPTVPLVILAAACFARASPRLEAWLLAHPRFGPAIRDWRARGAISQKGKIAACIGMSIGFAAFLYFSQPSLWLALLVGIALLACALFVVSRPS
ncbi:MAG: YbaN family protein [Pseudomonadota bacterium]